jgi:tRNA (adenine57-N1/adenine58-N1)-methyltransferase catalytic subunit
MYYHNIDFHVGTIPSYLSTRLESSPSPFLGHAILDLPRCHDYFEIVNQSLKQNGTLTVFCPSITQINSSVQVVRNQDLHWSLETVLELGVGAGVGGREWDVRFVKPRAVLMAELEAKRRHEEKQTQQRAIMAVENADEDGGSNVENVEDMVEEKTEGGWEMVCRPKVGGRISGGGFLAQWRKLR